MRKGDGGGGKNDSRGGGSGGLGQRGVKKLLRSRARGVKEQKKRDKEKNCGKKKSLKTRKSYRRAPEVIAVTVPP